MRVATIVILVPVLAGISGTAAGQPLLAILQETGQMREGLPVYEIHPDDRRIAAALSDGLSGHLLQLYRSTQLFLNLQEEAPPEPAYLLLSGNQGGFPRFGFFLGDQDKRGVGYVDLHRSSPLHGRFGALDQIFPHELAHVIVQQLAGPSPPGGSGRVHAIAVRTDQITAFQEGFAEHFQALAVEDPEADPSTGALAGNSAEREWMERNLDGYRREMSAFWSPATRHRLGFPLWFGRCERALRYFAVKANAFAHAPQVPDRLLGSHSGYLLESVLPGSLESPLKTSAQMLASEGVISALFYRWANSPGARETYREDDFYAAFGTSRQDVEPLDNVYLKIFRALRERKAQNTVQLIEAYRELFPDESIWIDNLLDDMLLRLPETPPLWLENPGLRVGTTVYDQFRSAPHNHRFDLNAASLGDLMAISGMKRPWADEILRRAPYRSLADLRREVADMPPKVNRRLAEMADLAGGVDPSAEESEFEAVSLLTTILMSFVWRAAAMLFLAAASGAALSRLARRGGWPRAVFRGCAASLLGLAASLLVTAPAGSAAMAASLLLCGVPAALLSLLRTRSRNASLRVLLAWLAAALPMALLTTPI